MAKAEPRWNRPPLEAPSELTPRELDKRGYEKELTRLQVELVRLQDWIVHTGLKVVVLFEGRDTAGKGGTIKRITEKTNPRVVRTVALGTPTERERTQWYFQRYVAHLPAAGEIVICLTAAGITGPGSNMSWASARRTQHEQFLRALPAVRTRPCCRRRHPAGEILAVEVSDEEQERRFKARLKDPAKQWKLSGMDLEARRRWVDYAEAKDDMFAYTDTRESPWYVVEADDKRTLRLNLISHLLSLIPYEDVRTEKFSLPPRQDRAYVRPPRGDQNYVPERYRIG